MSLTLRPEGIALAAQARAAGLPLVSLDPGPLGTDPVDPAAAWLVDARLARELGLIPVVAGPGRISVAVADAAAEEALERVAALTGREPSALLAPLEEIEAAQDRVYGVGGAGAADPADERKRRLGELLVESGVATADEVDEALALQRRYGARVGEQLAHAGVVGSDEVSGALAEQLGLTFADLDRIEPDEQVVRLLPEAVAKRFRIAPVALFGGELWLAAAAPDDAEAREWLERHVGLPVRMLVGVPRAVDRLLERVYAGDNSRLAIRKLVEQAPHECAHVVLYPRQRIALGLLAAALAIGLALAPIATLIVVNVLAIILYSAVATYRFVLIYRALNHHYELEVSDDELALLDESQLPVYTILVPLFREGDVVPHLTDAIARLDYPATKLDVQLLLEQDDAETLAVVRALDLPPHFRPVLVPPSQPQTKPKACNYGLTQARGELVVIYDAEDRPEPDQLKKVLVGFAKNGPELICIQSKLNYFNRDQNALTRWFTTEYSMWFDLMLPGLDATGAPIPLGGTSNHFITAKLLELGGWDPFNVTEDADLGLRLDRAGYRTAMVDSTTFEEANSDVFNWIRQRSRWVKGYIQTWLVQMRNPIRLLRQIGLKKWLAFQLVVGGTFLTFLLNPLYWLLTTAWVLTEADVISSLFPSFLYYGAAFSLVFGNFVFAYVTAAGASRRGYHSLVKWALISPLYWALMSIGAWKGLIQLCHKPFFWEKTVHGLDGGRG